MKAPFQRSRWFVTVAVSTGLLATGFAGWKHARRAAVEGWYRYRALDSKPTADDEATKTVFLNTSRSLTERYDALFDYFLRGFIHYARPGYARVQYPGLGSFNGYRISGLEGFAETAPLLAAWIYSGRPSQVADKPSGRLPDLVAVLRQGILSGTNERSPHYWGNFQNYDERTVQAADVARMLWLTRAQIWDSFSPAEKQQVGSWLEKVNHVKVYDNNWLLFPAIVNAALKNLGYGKSSSYDTYYRFKGHYLESGWFFDTPGVVDFYNTWGINYDLFWLHRLDPTLDPDFIMTAVRESAELTSLLISDNGLPIMGRSECYRTAVPVPLLARGLLEPSEKNVGMAQRSLDAVWRYFVNRNVLRDGTLTMGYFDTDPRFVDLYTGPGSCHWGLRSLILAYMQPSDGSFWQGPSYPLPIDVRSYRRSFPLLGWEIHGDAAKRRIIITRPAYSLSSAPAEPYGWWTRFREWVDARPLRPENRTLKYELHEYRSDQPISSQP